MKGTLLTAAIVTAGLFSAPAQSPDARDHAAAWRTLAQETGVPDTEHAPVKCGLPMLTHALAQQRHGKADMTQALRTVLSRPVMDMSIRQGSFRVHFDTAGYNTPAMLDAAGRRIPGTTEEYVDSVLSILAAVAPYESQVLGYGPFPADGNAGGGSEYDVYILELGSMYGYTTPDAATAEGGTSPTFITIDNDFVFVQPAANRGLPALRVTIAHELHHALQIGNYGYWTNDVFFYEITSTWMEDVVFPEVNDYYEYLKASWGHFRNPDKPFASDDLIMYSRGIWGHFVSKRFDTLVMRNTWEAIRALPPLQAMDKTLRTRGSDLSTAFSEWVLWNAFTASRSDPVKYYNDGADYPPMMRVPIEYTPPSRDLTGSLQPLASRYYQVVRGADTMTVIVCNADAAGAVQENPPAASYTVRLRSSRPDDGYRLTPLGVYASLAAADIALWRAWYVMGDTVHNYFDPEALAEGRPLPNPFVPDGRTRVYVPVSDAQEVRGSLYIYSAGLGLVYASDNAVSSPYLGRQMFSWDGRRDGGAVAPSGVYVYVLELPGRRLTGKIAVVRK